VQIARVELLLAGLLLAAAAAQGAELGTLFSTPEERARLDRLRRGEPLVAAQAAGGATAHAITGYVKRSDGRSTVWIDGSPVALAPSRAASALDPRVVRAYADREGNALRIERKPPN
jgi:hypothetical protein